MSNGSRVVAPGDDLYRIAAEIYGDAAAWTLIARGNGLTDPIISKDATLSIPSYDKGRAQDGVLSDQ